MTRTYKLRQRAEALARTRQRIVEAAIALHQENGIAATSVSDIAARAKVGKVTVYRHFPDETALVQACSGQYFARHAFPDPDEWRRVPEARARLQLGLRETYAYHRATAQMMDHALREAGDQPIMAPYHAHWRHAAEVLAEAWPEEAREDRDLRAALALALSYYTWRVLAVERGLTDEAAAELMGRLPPLD